MKLLDVIELIDISTISSYTLNGKEASLQTLTILHGELEVVKIKITGAHAEITDKDVAYSFFSKTMEEIDELVTVEQQLPYGSSYINLCLNIITKDND